jgi:FG-GAP-like repeat
VTPEVVPCPIPPSGRSDGSEQVSCLGNNHVAADFNGDGRLDIAGQGAQAAAVLLNRGDGSFGARVDYPVAGATSATFPVGTSSVAASTAVTISGAYGGTTRSATLTVTPPATLVRLTVTATGRSGERITSSPTGINVSVGSTGSAPFPTGTSITLSASNGRDVIWSGACSSGGAKARNCTFTISGNASVTGNVQ